MNTIYDAKILIVDDNADLLALLCEQLRGAGYGKIRTAQSCGGARAAFAAGQPELMILDINLPDGDGFSLFRALRAKADVPALFLSARDADADRLFGLGLGADDYLTKPFLMQELLLRVQHILQRAYRAELSAGKPTALQLGPRSVELNDAVVSLPDGKTLALTATELALLRKLAENRGHIVTYDALCDAVWGADYYGYENSLENLCTADPAVCLGRCRHCAFAAVFRRCTAGLAGEPPSAAAEIRLQQNCRCYGGNGRWTGTGGSAHAAGMDGRLCMGHGAG